MLSNQMMRTAAAATSKSATRVLSTLKKTPVAESSAESAAVSTSTDEYTTAAAAEKPFLMTNSEAFVETMVAHGVDTTFGIVGSAFMDSLDLFPDAGIRFVSVQHEQNAAHMADGYARVTGNTGVCIAQNGPGITNFVTGIAAAYWAHSPVMCITPQAGTNTEGLGGFQETEQLPFFQPITKAQVHVSNPNRMAELTGVAFDACQRENGPVQLNIPRDFFYGESETTIPGPNVIERSAGGVASLERAAEAIQNAKNPVILAGGGVVMSKHDGIGAVRELAEFLRAPVATTYLHNDAFPSDHPLWAGPLGYCGHKTAMHSIKDSDCVIVLGSRLGPFGTNPQYGIDYWPKDATLIQVDVDPTKVGRVKSLRANDVGIAGDAALAARDMLSRLQGKEMACASTTEQRLAQFHTYRDEWENEMNEMAHAHEYAAEAEEGRMVPRQVLRELEMAMPDDAMVSTDIGNSCSVSNGYLRFKSPRSYLAAMTFGNCGYAFPAAMGAKVARPDRPAVAYVGDGAWGMSLNEVMTCVRETIPTTAVVFNNRQWGAEKKNQVLWFGDRYVGVNLENPSFAEVARSMGAEGITVDKIEDVGPALKKACEDQKAGLTTVIEVMTTRELGDPFRRDAMKLPQRHLNKYSGTNEEFESFTEQPVDLAGAKSN